MNKLSKAITGISIFAVMPFVLLNSVHAQVLTFTADNYELPGPDGDLMEWVLKIINWIIGASALVAVVMIVYSGFQYITASGDENKIAKASKTLTFAIVGLVLCFISGMIVNFIINNFLNA